MRQHFRAFIDVIQQCMDPAFFQSTRKFRFLHRQVADAVCRYIDNFPLAMGLAEQIIKRIVSTAIAGLQRSADHHSVARHALGDGATKLLTGVMGEMRSIICYRIMGQCLHKLLLFRSRQTYPPGDPTRRFGQLSNPR